MLAKHLKVGIIGERSTCNHLMRKGFKHIESNFRAKTGEIDLIMKKATIIHFIEVKTVSRGIFNTESHFVSHGTYRPEDNVHRDKLRKIFNTIQVWISKKHYMGEWQLDVASVALDTENKKATIYMINNVIME